LPAGALTLRAMTPDDFIAKWQGNTRPERAAYVEHFNDLCRLLALNLARADAR
jgi:hypothetical protein